MSATRRSGRVLGATAVLTAAGLVATGCSGSEVTAPPVLGLAARLVSFDSCDQLLGWFRDEAGHRVTAYGLEGSGGPIGLPAMAEDAAGVSDARSSAPTAGSSATSSSAGPSFSGTNVQEVGVGEPDLTVTDGARLVSVVGGTLRVVDLTAPSPTVTGSIQVPGGSGQLLVDGDRALVLSSSYGPAATVPDDTVGGASSSAIAPSYRQGTTLTRVDLDGTPRVVGSVSVDATYVDARMVDGVVRVVTRSGPEGLGFVYPTGSASSQDRSLAANRRVVAESTLDDWLPSVTLAGPDGRPGDARQAVGCDAVERPEAFSGFDVVTVLGLDLRGGGVDLLPSAAVVAGAGTVYASSSTLYVTTERWPEPGTVDQGTVPDGGTNGSSTGTAITGSGAAAPGAGASGSAVDAAPPAAGEVAPSSPAGRTDPAAPSAPVSVPEGPTTTTAPSSTTSSTSTSSSTTSTTSSTTTSAPPATTVLPPTSVPATTVVPDPGTTVLPAPGEQGPYTDVHAFSIGGRGPAAYLASGRVRGTVLDQFSLSEHDGRLRVATTVRPDWWGWRVPMAAASGRLAVPVAPGTSESFVTVLQRSAQELARVGEVGGLGRGEQIYSTRFVGDLAYVVTFRRTDPLYVIDLRDPTRPVVAGELEIPGYSSYLQDLGGGRLLGVGQDATEQGRVTGFAESLFDVADPATPSRLSQLVAPGAHSMAEQDHHALLWWAPTGTLVVPLEQSVNLPAPGPVTGAPRGGWFSGVLVTTVTDEGIVERGRLIHPLASAPQSPGGGTLSPGALPGVAADCATGTSCIDTLPVMAGTPIERALVVGDRLLTISSAGVMANALTTLEQQSWTPFSS